MRERLVGSNVSTAAREVRLTLRTCVLIHGGWRGGWHWNDVAASLRQAVAGVYAPTLTGLAERAGKATPATNLSTHISDFVRVIDEHHVDDIALAAHSYGEMGATGVTLSGAWPNRCT